MNLFEQLEKRIDKKLRGLFRGEASQHRGREVIEIQKLILERIHENVQSLPRARKVFPYNDVQVRIPVAEPDRRTALEMVLVEDSALQQDVMEAFRRDGTEFPPDLQVSVTLYDTAEIEDLSIICRNREKPVAQASDKPPKIRFTLVSSGEVIDLAKSRIHIGRLADVQDDRRRTVRRNDVVLDDETVSRAHAHIEWDVSSGEYRIFDDSSTYGTGVAHDGRIIDVPVGGGRGIRIQPGDEIYLGQARLRVDSA